MAAVKKGVRPLRKKLKSKAKPKKKPVVKAKKPIANVKKKRVVKTAKKNLVQKKAAKPAKKPTKTAKKIVVKKPVARQPSVLKIKKTVVRKKPTAVKATPPVAVIAKPPKPTPIVAKKTETQIGTVMHYYAQIGVAVVQLNQKVLRVGDTIHIKGHTTDFTQAVESMEVEHQPVTQVKAGDLFGMKVTQHVREGDGVSKL